MTGSIKHIHAVSAHIRHKYLLSADSYFRICKCACFVPLCISRLVHILRTAVRAADISVIKRRINSTRLVAFYRLGAYRLIGCEAFHIEGYYRDDNRRRRKYAQNDPKMRSLLPPLFITHSGNLVIFIIVINRHVKILLNSKTLIQLRNS